VEAKNRIQAAWTTDLAVQVRDEHSRKKDEKITDMIYAMRAEDAFAADETLNTMHPQIRATPDYVIKQQVKET
jgi:hypothetical protein